MFHWKISCRILIKQIDENISDITKTKYKITENNAKKIERKSYVKVECTHTKRCGREVLPAIHFKESGQR
jgi:hypothetical protein